jgi:two-component system, NarL family, invasion response regulator UvrY
VSDIYLLDDHALMRDGLRAVLELGGHRVVGESADPGTALADILRLTPGVLLLDLKLGQRSGFELLEQLPRHRLGLRTIVITMSDQPQHVAEALRLGAAGYVLKGSPASAVLAAVNQVVHARQYLGPGVGQLAAQALSQPCTSTQRGALDPLSARERQIIALVVRGHTSAAIGEQLRLSPKTVDSYRSRLMGKLGVSDVPALVRLAIREGLISASEI